VGNIPHFLDAGQVITEKLDIPARARLTPWRWLSTDVGGSSTVPAVVAAHDELVIDTGGRRWRVRHVPKAPVYSHQ
jgi:hypothetical protein